MTQHALAKAMGVSQQTVSHWERDLARPNPDKLALLLTTLGVVDEGLVNESFHGLYRVTTFEFFDDVMQQVAARLGPEVTEYGKKLARLPPEDRRTVEALIDRLLGE